MKNYISTIKFKLTNKLMKLTSDSRGIGTIEMVLLIVDNPFTSSTYILSY